MTRHSYLQGYAYVLVAIIIWAGWIVASRAGVKGALTPYDITAIRFTVAGLILLPVALKRGLKLGPWGIVSGFILSAIMGAGYTNIAVAGMLFAPASHASTLINGALLLLTTLIGIKWLGESTTRLRLLGVAFSATGILCMLFAKSIYGGENQWLGHVLFIIAGLMWGTYTLLVRAWKIEAVQGATVVCVFSLITYVPLYAIFAQSHISWNTAHEVAFQAVYQGLLTGVIALIAYNRGIAILGASRAGAFIPLVPVLATLLAIPVLHEVPSPLEWIGVAAVAFGVLLASGLVKWQIGRIKAEPI